MPDGQRPFGALEPVVRTIRCLDPKARTSYFQPPLPTGGPDILRTASAIDVDARHLIGFCLDEAAAEALPEAQGLSAIARRNRVENPEALYIELLAHGEPADQTARRRRRETLKAQLAAARAMRQTANRLSRDIKARLDALEAAPPAATAAETASSPD